MLSVVYVVKRQFVALKKRVQVSAGRPRKGTMTPEEEVRLLRWELKMRTEGYVAPFPEELMLAKIRKGQKQA